MATLASASLASVVDTFMSSSNHANATVEDKIRQYLALFDGTKKDFSLNVESAFDGLYHDGFIGTDRDRAEIVKETMKQLEEKRLAAGAKITNFAFSRMGWNKALVEYQLKNKGESFIAQYLVTIKDKKIIEARSAFSMSGIIKASWLSDYHTIRRIYGHQNLGKVVFEGNATPLASNELVYA